jgi:glutamate--cysteine ligase
MKQKHLQINPYTLLANIGLEKESLRVTERGRLAQTPHPFPDDPNLDVDFSANQTEFITGIHSSPTKVYDELWRLHRQALRTMTQRETGAEFFWPFSNPPYVASEQENLPMQFEDENRWKTEYREHLRRRYGTRLMLYSGIHFNFSFQEEFFDAAGLDSKEDRNEAYLNLAAWATRYAWLVVYLLAASPVMDPSILGEFGDDISACRNSAVGSTSPADRSSADRLHTNPLPVGRTGGNERTEGNEESGETPGAGETADATSRSDQLHWYASPRCSEIGYWNTFDPVLDYRDFDKYIHSVQRYVDDGTLMYPAELYYPVRLKPAGRYSMAALEQGGISHIEIRTVDENPYSPVGILPEDIQFLHLLMVYLMHQPPKPFPPEEQLQALHDMKTAALYDDSAKLSSGKSTRCAARSALHDMEGFFRRGAFTRTEQAYIRETLDYQWKKFAPGGRTAERVRQDFETGYNEKGLRLAQQHAATILSGFPFE